MGTRPLTRETRFERFVFGEWQPCKWHDAHDGPCSARFNVPHREVERFVTDWAEVDQ